MLDIETRERFIAVEFVVVQRTDGTSRTADTKR